MISLSWRILLASMLACGLGSTATAQAQVEGLEIITPAGSGG
jgi:hypothetical protein